MKKRLAALFVSAASMLVLADSAQEQKNFIATIQLGQHLLERKLVAPHFSAIQRHFPNAVKQLSAMSPEEAKRELEAFESIMLQLSFRCTGQPYSPNVGWFTKERLAGYEKDLLETRADWKNNSQSLARFGLYADADFEWNRLCAIRAAAPKLKTLPVDPRFDLAFSFYRKIAEERFRLGAQIILFENELDALQRTAAFRKLLGMKIKQLDTGAIRSLLKQWREEYNRKNYIRCAELEQKTGQRTARLREQVFAADGTRLVNRELTELSGIAGLDTTDIRRQVFTLFYRNTGEDNPEIRFVAVDNFRVERTLDIPFSIEDRANTDTID